MRPRLLLILTLIVLMPLLALGWLGLRLARQERAIVENRFQEALVGRLQDINATVVRSIEKQERELLGLLERASDDTAELRDLTRKSPLIRSIFVLDAKGNRLHPPPDGPLTEPEREFLERSGQVWRDKDSFRTFNDGTGAAIDRGWYTWYWGNGVNFVFWLRDASGRVIGAECDRTRLLADVVGELPNSDPADPNLAHSRIALMDPDGIISYQWGAYDPAAKEPPRANVEVGKPMNAWSLLYFAPATKLDGAFGGSNLLTLGVGMGALVLALVGLALYFYRESTREMREAAERVSFVNQVSHELKTPLTNIRMYAELLDRSIPPDDAKGVRHLDVIVSESQRLSRLIGNVLTFARQRNRKLTLHPSEGSIDRCIQFVLDHFRAAFESKNVRVVFTSGADTTVEFDRDAMEQILGNLFSNVEKYSASGGLMEVESRYHDGITTVVVADRGPGIPKGLEDRIFEPFHRLSNKLSDGVTGTGIGLSIARNLAREHGGDLRVVPSDVGARFELKMRTPASRSANEVAGA